MLLTGTDESRRERPVLVYQRYGRGRAFAFTLQDTWLWQMLKPISEKDMSHEFLWRQLLRALVDGVPDLVEPRSLTDRVEPGEAITLRADVVDKQFVELNDASVVAHVSRPDGTVVDVPMQWSGERSGEYTASVPAGGAGQYEARIEATRAGQSLGTTVAHVRAAPGDAEYFDATMHAPTLRRIAEETGGRFYTSETMKGLAEDLRYTGRGVTTVEERELWHMPIIFIVLVGVVVRRMGLPPRGGAVLRCDRCAGCGKCDRCEGATRATAATRDWCGDRALRRVRWCGTRAGFRIPKPSHDTDPHREDAVRRFVHVRATAPRARGRARAARGRTTIPRAERNFTRILKEITLITPNLDKSNVLTQDDPDLFASPILYVSEPGYWTMTDEELANMGEYVSKGGFLIFDDFRGEHYFNFEEQVRRLIPNARLVQIDPEHQVFHSFFDIDITETRGYYGPASFQGVFEDNDPAKRLLLVANYNHDLGEMWEFSAHGIRSGGFDQ